MPATTPTVPPAAFELGDVVWWQDASHAGLFRRGEVLGVTARGLLRVALDEPAREAVVEVPAAQLLAANPTHLEGSDDLGDLSVLNPASMLRAVGSRFRAKPHEQIYTRAGALLLSVNPYRDLPSLYSYATARKYALGTRDVVAGDPSGLAPHLFEIAGVAFSSLVRERTAQAIVVSGESGAGKTEATKKMLDFLAIAADLLASRAALVASPARGPSSPGSGAALALCVQLLESGPLLEALGNAKTRRNDNSSRFGKLIQLRFDRVGAIVGGSLSHYLLEQARVVGHGPGERSFHLFYQLCARASGGAAAGVADGGEAEMLGALNLRPACEYSFLNPGALLAPSELNDATGQQLDDAAECDLTLSRLERLFPSRGARTAVLQVVAAVLNLGQIEFAPSPSDDSRAVLDNSAKTESALNATAALLRVDAVGLRHALLERQICAAGETCFVPKSTTDARDSKDALAKALYVRLFDHVVKSLNAALAEVPQADGDGDAVSSSARGARRAGAAAEAAADGRLIALLDIFGFEVFETNSLEQLLINYANERLQAHFHRTAIARVLREYAAEGIALGDGVFSADNSTVLMLLDGRPEGILSLLNEDCLFPSNDAQSFVHKLTARHGGHPNFSVPKVKGDAPSFIVAHYALSVTYDASLFLRKNKDALYAELIELVAASGAPLVSSLFGGGGSAVGHNGGSSGAPAALSEQLVRQASQLSSAPLAPTAQLVGTRPGLSRKDRQAAAARVRAVDAPPTSTRRGGRAGQFVGVAASFSDALGSLIALLDLTQTHFVRCVKPNHTRRPHELDAALVCRQLASAGLVDAVRVARGGFPSRLPPSQFVEHFALLAPQAAAPAVGSLRHRCAALLAVVLPQQASYRMGTSLVFLGQGVLASLERARAVRLARAAVAVQRRQRGCLARAAWRRARSSVARIQRSWRTAHGRIAPPPSLSRERTPSEPVVPTTRAQPVEQVGVGAPPGSELRSRAAHAQAVSESASRLAAELAKLQALALASPTLDERALLAEAVVREEELQNLEADNSALAAANVELQSEVDELIGDLVPTKLLLAHAEDEKAAMLRELHTLAAKLGAAETELELMRQAAASRAGNFGLFAARR